MSTNSTREVDNALGVLLDPDVVVGQEWDGEILASLAVAPGADDGWLDAIGRDVVRRAGSGAGVVLSAWAVPTDDVGDARR